MFWCFHCYGQNAQRAGACVHCGQEIAMPAGISYEEQLIWTLGHPDGDRALLAAGTLGRRGAKVAAPRLRELASSSADPFLAVASLRGLLEIEGAEALRPLLVSLAEHGSFMVANIAREALYGLPGAPGVEGESR